MMGIMMVLEVNGGKDKESEIGDEVLGLARLTRTNWWRIRG